MWMLVACGGPAADSASPVEDTRADTSADTADTSTTASDTSATESSPDSPTDSAPPEDSGGDDTSTTTTWGGACEGLAPDPIMTYRYSSTWTNGACPSAAPYDVSGWTWDYGSLIGSAVAFQAETLGECSLDGQDVWLVKFYGYGPDYYALDWMMLVCDADGVRVAADIGEGRSRPHSYESVTYYDPPVLLFPATLVDGDSWTGAIHVERSFDWDTKDPPTETVEDVTFTGSVGSEATRATDGFGDVDAWATTNDITGIPVGGSVYVSDGIGIVEFAGSLSLQSSTPP